MNAHGTGDSVRDTSSTTHDVPGSCTCYFVLISWSKVPDVKLTNFTRIFKIVTVALSL